MARIKSLRISTGVKGSIPMRCRVRMKLAASSRGIALALRGVSKIRLKAKVSEGTYRAAAAMSVSIRQTRKVLRSWATGEVGFIESIFIESIFFPMASRTTGLAPRCNKASKKIFNEIPTSGDSKRVRSRREGILKTPSWNDMAGARNEGSVAQSDGELTFVKQPWYQCLTIS
jgi:hypothetical protein